VRIELRLQLQPSRRLPADARERAPSEVTLPVREPLTLAEPRDAGLTEHRPVFAESMIAGDRQRHVRRAAAGELVGVARRQLDAQPGRDGCGRRRSQRASEVERNIAESALRFALVEQHGVAARVRNAKAIFWRNRTRALRQAEEVVPAVDGAVEHAAARVAIGNLQLRREAIRPRAADRHACLTRFSIDDQLLCSCLLHQRNAGPVEVGRDRPGFTRQARGQRCRQPEAS
jgi:hypothetical protein